MKAAVGSDHAGYTAKLKAIEVLKDLGCEVEDVGTHSEASCDYPDFALAVAERVAHGDAEIGVLCCGTGIGMSMAANKVHGVRAGVCHNDFTCEMTRRHNDANVLCLGSRVVDDRMVENLVRLFVHTPFEGGRHQRRVRKIDDIDRTS